MSLIQEALKRQQMEQEKSKAPAAGAPAPTSPTAPAEPPRPADEAAPASPESGQPPATQAEEQPAAQAAPAADSGGKKAPKVILVVVLVLVLIGVAAWLIFFGISILWKPKETPQPTMRAATNVPPAVVTNAPPQRTNEVPEATNVLNAATNRIPESTSSVARVDVPTNPPAVTPTPPPTVEPPQPPTQAVVIAPKPPPVWPAFSVRAIVGRGRNGSVNVEVAPGKKTTIGVGDSVEGAKLVGLEKNGAVFEFEGERRALRVGDKTQ